jgi:hypothetical protein
MHPTRREFARLAGGAFLASLVPARLAKVLAGTPPAANAHLIFLEAEEFDDLGGWDTDQQSMDQMGSAYLLAHGLGVPVKDAVTSVKVPAPGKYRVWVRTRDWVAPWKAPGAPGKFQLLINGQPLPVTFGTEWADWHWQDGGITTLGAQTTVALHDLTGFEGRCDAVFFSDDLNFAPPNELTELTKFRRAMLGLSDDPEDGGSFDLVVIGGGIAGSSAALSAARHGLTVALVQDRPVLGGNGSSEVRVWPEGHTNLQPYPHIGDIVEELVSDKQPPNSKSGAAFDDARKTKLILAERRIKLLTDHRAFEVETSGSTITAVVAQHTHTGVRVRLRGKLFADCTGDADVGYLAKADFELSRDDHQGMTNIWTVMNVADSMEMLQCECKDKTALSMAAECGNVAAPFPRCPWAIDLSNQPFPGRKNYKGQWGKADPLANLGSWFWESGFSEDPITEVERIRDQNLRAMYGAWDALKNVDKLYPNYRLGWAAFIAGKRESRRLMGDVVLAVSDFLKGTAFPDAAFPCTWHIDLHSPDKRYVDGQPGEEFISHATSGKGYEYKGPYWAPYRCLYSRNITNMFMAGRDISVTHEALGPVRVMRTCGMMGEVVGKAASICIARNTTPRGVYESYLPELKELMNQPGAMRRES